MPFNSYLVPSKRAKKGCVHCWHVVSSTTDGIGVNGWDDQRCCHCGGERRQFWCWQRDPKHGSHVEVRERIDVE